MSVHQIHVFISHAWKYSGHYDKLSDWIFLPSWSSGPASLSFHDYSIPRNHPIHDARNDAELKEAIYNQIRRSHIIVIPTGMYANYSYWIKKELDGADLYGKPILGVNPWGQERKSVVVASRARRVVGWNSESVVSAIWDLHRQS